MTHGNVSLLLHVLAAAGLIAGATVQITAGVRVRASTTGRELATWAAYARSASLIIAISAVVALGTGGHLAGVLYRDSDVNGFTVPFVLYGIIGWFLLLPIGPMIGGPRLKQLAEQGAELGDEPLTPAIAAAAVSGNLWGAVHSLVGVAAAYIWIMQAKPEAAATGIILLAGLVAGWATGAYAASRSAPSGGHPLIPGPDVSPPAHNG